MGILSVRDLSIIHKKTNKTIVREINFDLEQREILGIVGESGSGKSITMHSILGLTHESLEVKGRIIFEGTDLVETNQFDVVRGSKIGIIFQDPLNALNPILRIEEQLKILCQSHNLDYSSAKKEIYEIFDRIGIHHQDRVLKSFPHQLSGGMLQRVVISFVLLLKPKVIIADEPTTSLDVSVQKEIINILKEVRDEYGISIIFITHDLLLAKDICDRVIIMYSGYIVEEGRKEEIFNNPLHPYTKGLILSVPDVNRKLENLPFIPGRVPHFLEIGLECPFANRCPLVEEVCYSDVPRLERIESRKVRCFVVMRKTATKI